MENLNDEDSQIDLNNYKGIFYQDDSDHNYQDKLTGAHFEYNEMCKRLKKLQHELQIANKASLMFNSPIAKNSLCPFVNIVNNGASRNEITTLTQKPFITVGLRSGKDKSTLTNTIRQLESFKENSKRRSPLLLRGKLKLLMRKEKPHKNLYH